MLQFYVMMNTKLISWIISKLIEELTVDAFTNLKTSSIIQKLNILYFNNM